MPNFTSQPLQAIVQLLTAITALIVAFTGLMAALKTIRHSSLNKGISDNVAWRLITIKQKPLDMLVYRKVRKNFIFYICFSIPLSLFYYILLPIETEKHAILSTLIYAFGAVYFSFLAYYFFVLLKSTGKTPDDAKHFLFHEVEMKVESDKQYLFRRLQEVLYGMQARVTDLDIPSGIVEGFLERKWWFPINLVITIQVKPLEENDFLLTISARFTAWKGASSVYRSTKIIRKFIKQLVFEQTKPSDPNSTQKA